MPFLYQGSGKAKRNALEMSGDVPRGYPEIVESLNCLFQRNGRDLRVDGRAKELGNDH